LPRRAAAGNARLARELERLRASLVRGERRHAGRPPFGMLTGWLFPRGEPQDRVMSLCQALWLYGPGLADTLVDRLGSSAERLLIDV
nr:hypothetical protein [Planctomycetota bacterium]